MDDRTEADASTTITATNRGVPRPVADHGIIGDLATLALVAKDGAIDFSAKIFAAFLD
jgi:hypothetical protein